MAELTEQAVRQIVEQPVTGLPGRTTRQEIIESKPDNGGREKEPVFIIDLSGSENEQADPESPMTKAELLTTAIPIAARKLAADDSQAAHETGTAKGGVLSYGFNEPGDFQGWNEAEAEFEDYRFFGDLHEGNVQETLGSVTWEGRTYIMPAIRAAEKAFQAEFQDRPLRNRPTMEVVIWTDGKLNDEAEFERWLEQCDEFCVVAVAVVGFGPGHDAAVNAYKRLAAKNKYISVAALTGVSSPEEIALDVQLMAA